jgi:predicted amidohydrolase YtcJ
MRDLEITLSTQPAFIESFGDGWRSVFGEDALGTVMPLKSALGLGMRVICNTDFPCSPINPFLMVKSAVLRKTRGGVVLDPSEAISVGEALRLVTVNPAWSGFEEHSRGSLELGKLADLVVISDDPYVVPPEELDQIKIDQTIVGGEVVYERTGS